MADLSAATDALADTDNYTDAGMVLAGLAISIVMKNGIDSRFNLPDEAYGLVTAGLGAAMGYELVAIGGMSYSGVKAAERFGLKSTVEQVGA
jgi:hypothetical protein